MQTKSIKRQRNREVLEQDRKKKQKGRIQPKENNGENICSLEHINREGGWGGYFRNQLLPAWRRNENVTKKSLRKTNVRQKSDIRRQRKIVFLKCFFPLNKQRREVKEIHLSPYKLFFYIKIVVN